MGDLLVEPPAGVVLRHVEPHEPATLEVVAADLPVVGGAVALGVVAAAALVVASRLVLLLQVDHEGALVVRLSSDHLVDGVARVVGRLGDVDAEHGPGVIGKRRVFHAFLYLKYERGNETTFFNFLL